MLLTDVSYLVGAFLTGFLPLWSLCFFIYFVVLGIRRLTGI